MSNNDDNKNHSVTLLDGQSMRRVYRNLRSLQRKHNSLYLQDATWALGHLIDEYPGLKRVPVYTAFKTIKKRRKRTESAMMKLFRSSMIHMNRSGYAVYYFDMSGSLDSSGSSSSTS